jgi:hypothetical protein
VIAFLYTFLAAIVEVVFNSIVAAQEYILA